MTSIVDLDSILGELGHLGRYQVINYALILLPIMLTALYNGQFVFTAGVVPFRCLVPECESSPPEFDAGSWAEWALGGNCQRPRPDPPGGVCEPPTFHEDTIRCEEWLYQSQRTVFSEFGLACQEWKRTLVGTIHSVGMFAALPITAFVSDRFGRKSALILTATAAGAFGLARSFSTNYIMFIIFEFLEPTFGSGVYSTGFILALEMVGLHYRVIGGNIISSFFALGQVLLALAAWWMPNWRDLTRLIYAPSLIFVVYYFLIEESVRWLLSEGNKKEAARIIFKAAVINKTKLSAESIRHLTSDEVVTQVDDEQEKPQSLFKQVMKSRIIKTRLLICSFWWITVVLVYYGLSINSVTLAGNQYVNYILTALVEIPGYALSAITLDRFGRKVPIMIAFCVCGLSLLGLPFVPHNLQWVVTTLTMLGKLCISMTFSSIYIYTSELFPTAARHSLLGFCSMIGRIGSILAPQTPLLMQYMPSLPYLLFGIMSLISGILMLFTPETVRRVLPDTVAQAENINNAERPLDTQTPVK